MDPPDGRGQSPMPIQQEGSMYVDGDDLDLTRIQLGSGALGLDWFQ